jgi:hypothetical protein
MTSKTTTFVCSLPAATRARALVAPVDLLLQHDAVDAGLEQGEGETRLALEVPQAVEDVGARV